MTDEQSINVAALCASILVALGADLLARRVPRLGAALAWVPILTRSRVPLSVEARAKIARPDARPGYRTHLLGPVDPERLPNVRGARRAGRRFVANLSWQARLFALSAIVAVELREVEGALLIRPRIYPAFAVTWIGFVGALIGIFFVRGGPLPVFVVLTIVLVAVLALMIVRTRRSAAREVADVVRAIEAELRALDHSET